MTKQKPQRKPSELAKEINELVLRVDNIVSEVRELTTRLQQTRELIDRKGKPDDDD